MPSLNLLSLSPEVASQIAYLRSPVAIRERCGKLFELACADRLQHFRCDLSRLDAVADYVLQVTQHQYPDGNIPFHSRWRHFEVGSSDRLGQLESQLAHSSALEKARAKVDLAVVSVLLDAGAGASWRYTEHQTGDVYCRSEGLAIASFWMFYQGLFSSDRAVPLQVTASALHNITTAILAEGFQVHDNNPLIGLLGRTELLQQLGNALVDAPHLFGSEIPRPGHVVDYLFSQAVEGRIAAAQIFSAVLEGFSTIWAGRLTIAEVNLGDVWGHPALKSAAADIASHSADDFASLVPFHKLSQWLTYSLLEPLQDLGLTITGLEALTGLPEYRNGGLCLDLGLLQVKNPDILAHSHVPGSDVIVEWRALTVILLDRIAATIQHRLGLTATQLPLVKVLQGGTWTAGRQIAADLRSGGVPPLQIDSDGTVF